MLARTRCCRGTCPQRNHHPWNSRLSGFRQRIWDCWANTHPEVEVQKKVFEQGHVAVQSSCAVTSSLQVLWRWRWRTCRRDPAFAELQIEQGHQSNGGCSRSNTWGCDRWERHSVYLWHRRLEEGLDSQSRRSGSLFRRFFFVWAQGSTKTLNQ